MALLIHTTTHCTILKVSKSWKQFILPKTQQNSLSWASSYTQNSEFRDLLVSSEKFLIVPYHSNSIVIICSAVCHIKQSVKKWQQNVVFEGYIHNGQPNGIKYLKYFRIMHKLSQWLKMLKDWKYSTCDQNTNWKGCICQIVRRGNFPPVCTEGKVIHPKYIL